MGTYTQFLYHFVFSTKHRKHCMQKSGREELFKYITGLLINKKCHLYRINGVEDHLHIACSVHPSISVSNLIKDIKLASSFHINKISLFSEFEGWQEGYGAFTYSIKDKDHLIEYVKNQEEHHKIMSFKEEYLHLLHEHSIDFDEKYLL